MKTITIDKIAKMFELETLTFGENPNEICSEEIYRPGLELTGFCDFFSRERIHIFGKQEMTYISLLNSETREKRLEHYFKMKPPCVVITRGLEVKENLIKIAQDNQVPILRTKEKTTNFISNIHNYLQKELAPELGIHGVCVNIFGVGIIIRGNSGIGKSEIALSLIERGHRLIADDLVVLKKIGPVSLIGTHNGINHDFLSLRGIGFVNVSRLYGAGSIQSETKINLDIHLIPWEDGTYYDAVGIDEKKSEYLGIDLPMIEIPIRPGRDIASLLEVAAKNWRLKNQGYNTLEDFYKRIN